MQTYFHFPLLNPQKPRPRTLINNLHLEFTFSHWPISPHPDMLYTPPASPPDFLLGEQEKGVDYAVVNVL